MIGFIVTGCGRSSTMWTAQALTAAGLPCSHEHWCSSWTDNYDDDLLWREAPAGLGESSWQAAPFADDMQGRGVKVVHLVRHPVEVASSLVSNKMLEGEPRPWHNFAMAHVGGRLRRLHPVDRALWFWTAWNRLIVEPDLRWIVPVVPQDIDDLGRLLGRVTDPQKAAYVSPTNHWAPVQRLGRQDFTPSIYEEAMDLWESYV